MGFDPFSRGRSCFTTTICLLHYRPTLCLLKEMGKSRFLENYLSHGKVLCEKLLISQEMENQPKHLLPQQKYKNWKLFVFRNLTPNLVLKEIGDVNYNF